ncbi:hypothetical protein [Sphingomonas abietis]|uniref:Uncharacterized protein n=1 Tax=Sphingomonas abietis TaxID=3012344 RepID=A0ABY7NP02_9SPHN|nr:hypothetical protein [Sphingomonas abietis]WBO23260.1 hypothetical protein PBT88_03725 [Sphingomonas abietis]
MVDGTYRFPGLRNRISAALFHERDLAGDIRDGDPLSDLTIFRVIIVRPDPFFRILLP